MTETEQKTAVEQSEEVKKEQVEIKQEQENHEEHEHDHDHPHDHEHDHDHDHHHHDEKESTKKSNRGEKKFKKAMLKLGMKQVTGINRVTIKKTKQLLLYIDNPEVLKSAGQDNSYIIFGEAKIHDVPQNIANEEVKKFQPEKPVEQKEEENQEKKEEGEKKEEVEEKKEEKKELKDIQVSEDNITTVMEQTKCTREKAIETLKKNEDDPISAIMELTG